MSGSGTSPFWVLGSGATMNVPGNITSGQQVRLAGTAGSVFNLSGADVPAILYVLAQVNLTAGSMTPSSSFFVGYNQTINGTAYSSGTFTVSGSATATFNGNIYIIGRSGGSGTLILTNSASVTIGNSTANRNLAINFDSSAGSSGTVNVYNGTLTVGSGLQPLNVIDFFDTAGSGVGSGATATLNQTGGTINAVNGIVFGPASGSFGFCINWVGRTPWSARDAPVPLPARRIKSSHSSTGRPGGRPRTRGSAPLLMQTRVCGKTMRH